ncbi:hypothetical protein PLICRDRAFT_39244 [Plicaturopsis crispa FD-325 SS-3]|nr:hypothetical protein PLICRDRAFT_39244 [Plicaturopsis crispa FD-325 SS-3]
MLPLSMGGFPMTVDATYLPHVMNAVVHGLIFGVLFKIVGLLPSLFDTNLRRGISIPVVITISRMRINGNLGRLIGGAVYLLQPFNLVSQSFDARRITGMFPS